MADEAETRYCHNCKKQINAGNFMMHEMHCRRHIALCEHCQEPFPRDEMESHYEEAHAKTPCPKCQVQVEKQHLEDHQENDCAKKQMNCVYCLLEFPKNEFEAHTDYCGSRTEACPKCGQYIKLKDQVKHEDSNCRFPEAKPVNTNNTRPTGQQSTNDYLTGLPGFSPFHFDEMQRVLGGASVMPSYQTSGDKIKDKPSVGRSQPPTRRNVARVTKTVNVKPDVNQTSGNTGKNKMDSRAELDRLLALQIAEDDGRGEGGGGADMDGMEAMLRQLEKPSPYTSYNGRHTNNTFPEDMVMIPCEFCGEPFVADELVQHQSGCSLNRISSMLPNLGPGSNISNNSGVDAVGQSRMRSPIQEPLGMINNFPVYTADQWLDDTVIPTADPDLDDETLCLPCEFCCELFPVDTLVQHQAICDSNTTMTPRNSARSTAESRTKPRSKPAVNASRALADDFPNLSSRRHQPPPSFGIDLSDDEGDMLQQRGVQSKGATHTVRKPSTNSSVAPGNGANGVSLKNKKFGAQGQDRGDRYTRPLVYSRPLGETDERDTESWLQSQSQTGKSRTGSDQRTRSTLNCLLNDPSQGSQHDLLGHIGQQRSGVPGKTVNVKAGSRSKPPVTVTSRAPVTRTSTNPGSVPRASTNTSTGAAGLSNPARNRTSKPNFEVRVRPSEADQLSDVVSSQRGTNRTRVFDGGSRQRSDKR